MRAVVLSLCGVGVSLLVGCGSAGGECRTDTYPPAPEGASSIVHVSAGCPDDGADGSAAHPYGTISQGIASANAGAAVLVAPGEYPENIIIDKSLSLIGSAPGSKADEAGIIVQAPEPFAVQITGGDSALLRGLHVKSADSIGVWVKTGTTTLEGSVIESTAANGDGEFGHGVVTSRAPETPAGSSGIIVQKSAIIGSAGLGLLVKDAGAIIVQNELRDNGAGGIRVEVGFGEVKIDDNTLDGNSGVGIGVFSTKAIIVQNTVSNTKVGGTEGKKTGYGILAADLENDGKSLGATEITVGDTTGVLPKRNVISGNALVGILVSSGAGGIIVQNDVLENGIASAGELKAGAGIWLQGDAGGENGFRIDSNLVEANGRVGIGQTTTARTIIVQNTVKKTLLAEVFQGVGGVVQIGDGISIAKGAWSRVGTSMADPKGGNILEKNGRFGLIADGFVQETSILGNTFTDNDAGGIIVQNGGANAPSQGELESGNTITGGALSSQVLETGDMPYGVQDAEF